MKSSLQPQQAISDADQQTIDELQQKITDVRLGRLDEERFKHYRLTRGVYGQRQLGVQMFRTKIPFGRLTTRQLEALADASERYSTGNLHLTTRQNIQLHYVKLQDTPKLWADLAEVGVTAMGACGNTVRNITASAKAGIHPDELFDVSPYVQALFEYFLRHPICQEMGRKIKMAFSATDEDSAFAYFHDFGFIPRLDHGKRGFKVLLGGGLGAQSMVAHTVYDFLPEERVVPFVEAAIRVFDRYGEREKRMKARLKFMLKKWGVAHFLDLVEQEYKALPQREYWIDTTGNWQPTPPANPTTEAQPPNPTLYRLWRLTNTFEQKQLGYYGVALKIRLGDISAPTARALAAIVRTYAADELRLTINQGILLKYVPEAALPALYQALQGLQLADAGFGALVDITACPGTDTCNLGVTNSTGLATALEQTIQEQYAYLIGDSHIDIKISGCMNSCGQHMAANIGFHGSSMKSNGQTLPAMQVVLGGGVDPDGTGYIAEKIIKIPTRRIPQALGVLLDDYEDQQEPNEYFNNYVRRQGKRYFYHLLKPLADTTTIAPNETLDWGQDQVYEKKIGVGECAGVAYDMISAILGDATDKLQWAEQALREARYSDGIYLSYGAFVIAAKALLLELDVRCNTHIGIINDFDKTVVDQDLIALPAASFAELVLQLNEQEPDATFAERYWLQAIAFLEQIHSYRAQNKDKRVLSEHYKA